MYPNHIKLGRVAKMAVFNNCLYATPCVLRIWITLYLFSLHVYLIFEHGIVVLDLWKWIHQHPNLNIENQPIIWSWQNEIHQFKTVCWMFLFSTMSRHNNDMFHAFCVFFEVRIFRKKRRDTLQYFRQIF